MRAQVRYVAICLTIISTTIFSADDEQIRELSEIAQSRTSPSMRAEAVRKLLPYCANNADALSAVVKALALEDWKLRLEIADTVEKTGPAAIPFLAQYNCDNAREAAVMCAWIIRRIARQDLQAAFIATKNRNDQHQVVAAAIADDITGFLPQLQRLIASEEYEVSAGAAKALETAGVDARVAIPSLIEGFRKRRHWCGMALMAMGDDAIGPLVAALKDDFAPVREYSAQTLGKMCIKPSEVVPALIEALSDESMDVRVKASQALGLYRTDAKNAVPRLMEVASSIENSCQHNDLRRYSAEALGKIAPAEPKVVDVFISCLERADDDSRINAIRGLAEAGPDATKSVPKLLQLSKSALPHERSPVMNALGKIAPAQADVVAVLSAALKDKEKSVRYEATRALLQSGASGQPALPALKEFAADKKSSAVCCKAGYRCHYRWKCAEARSNNSDYKERDRDST